ncbi:hypothetical protein [Ascidiaceihabitans sp.]|uniref:hypothetical protein n=2 Tax=Ascidiaceihabitans sp. TaxID=1872644 RepID=UPI00329A7E62
MTVCYFWDWCPVSAVPWLSFTCKSRELTTSENRFFRYGNSLPDTVSYWIRTDGIFVFKLEISDKLNDVFDKNLPQNPSDKEKSKEVVKVAKLISDQIKGKEKVRSQSHGMLLPDNMNDCSKYGAISVTPRKLHDAVFPKDGSDVEIRDFLSFKPNLAFLKGKQIGDELDIQAPVALLLRQQFNTCFESAFLAVENIKYSKRLYLPSYRITEGKRQFLSRNGKGLDVKSVKFFVFAYLSVFLPLFTTIFLSNFEVRGGSELVLFFQSAIDASYISMSFITTLFLLLFMAVDVFSKRNPAIKAYSRAQEILRSGNLYCTVVENIVAPVIEYYGKPDYAAGQILDVAGVSNSPSALKRDLIDRIHLNGDFANAVEVLEVWKDREKEKRRLTVAVVGPLCLLGAIPLFTLISENMPLLAEVLTYGLSLIGIDTPP